MSLFIDSIDLSCIKNYKDKECKFIAGQPQNPKDIELLNGWIKFTDVGGGYYYCTNLNNKNNVKFYYGDSFQYYNPKISTKRTCL